MIELQRLMQDSPLMGAWFSLEVEPVYRYALWRVWSNHSPLLIVSMLNPSTADHRKDDPTIRRVIGFAKRDGFGGIIVLNAYAFRATNPRNMLAASDPVGPLNRMAFYQAAEVAQAANNGQPPIALMAHGRHGGEGGRRAFDILHSAGC
uniref:DUF1643 domain-containing protein n=1 Tax=uncultured Halomonas sp. TaxID=173971 RepID=UPI00260AFB77